MYFILVIVIILSLNIIYSSLVKEKPEGVQEEKKVNEFVSLGNSTLITMNLPAVDAAGNGVATILSVEAVPGSGRTLTDIENLLFWADTQQSIRMARFVANNISNKNVNTHDLIYTIKANASLIGGPSAGAAITIATIFALRREKPREDIMITGTINHDGSIGPVSAILEKAKASKQAGANIFLVPLLQSRDVVYETTEHCEKFGYTEICQTESIPRKIDVASEAGIQVIEVANINDALEYFKD